MVKALSPSGANLRADPSEARRASDENSVVRPQENGRFGYRANLAGPRPVFGTCMRDYAVDTTTPQTRAPPRRAQPTTLSPMVSEILKRDGRVVSYDETKIVNAIA